MKSKTSDLDIKRANLEAYDSFGELKGIKGKYWSQVENYTYGRVYALIQKQIGVVGKRICELGCGTAACLKWYKRDATEIVGLDISKKMLQLYVLTEGTAGNLSLVKGDALTLPFKDGAFDLITIYQSAHHFPDIYKCIDEMLRSASAFAFYEPNKDSIIHHALEWKRVRTMNDGRFNKHKYEIVEYNSEGFSAYQLRKYITKKGAHVKVFYIFALPMEISAQIMKRSQVLFNFLSLFGETLTHIPLLKTQFGGLLIMAKQKARNPKFNT
jgi:SAM-dependent methyltransferase